MNGGKSNKKTLIQGMEGRITNSTIARNAGRVTKTPKARIVRKRTNAGHGRKNSTQPFWRPRIRNVTACPSTETSYLPLACVCPTRCETKLPVRATGTQLKLYRFISTYSNPFKRSLACQATFLIRQKRDRLSNFLITLRWNNQCSVSVKSWSSRAVYHKVKL